MEAGKLDRRVTLLRPPSVAGTFGEEPEYEAVATVWAAWKPQRGREFQRGGRDIAESIDLFTIRFRSDIAESWRIQLGSTVYTIVSLAEIGRREGMEITARALS